MKNYENYEDYEMETINFVKLRGKQRMPKLDINRGKKNNKRRKKSSYYFN